MATLRIDQATFANEREVVKEERRMRIENQPFGRLNEIIYDHAFTTHPYKHPVIGSMADLNASTLEDVRDFYATYYVPSNATLVISGDFETDDRHRARRPASWAACRRPPVRCRATFRRSRRRRRRSASRWKRPGRCRPWSWRYHITYDGHPDAYPLHIVAKVLSDGQSSRIYRKLVYDTGLALTAFGQANLIEHPNLFYTVALVNPGQSPQAVEKALIAEMERIKTEGITDRELQRSKNQFLRDYVLGRETVQQKATHLAHAEVAHADVTTAENEFDIFQNITLADVTRVAKTYFKPESRVVLHIMPKGGVQ